MQSLRKNADFFLIFPVVIEIQQVQVHTLNEQHQGLINRILDMHVLGCQIPQLHRF